MQHAETLAVADEGEKHFFTHLLCDGPALGSTRLRSFGSLLPDRLVKIMDLKVMDLLRLIENCKWLDSEV